MLQFLAGKLIIQRAQAAIDRLTPKVFIHLPADLPLPSVSLVKKKTPIVAKINAMESELMRLSDDQLRLMTGAFKKRYQEGISASREEIQKLEGQFNEATTVEEREDLQVKLNAAEEELKKVKRTVLDQILPEAFAVVREAGRRVLNMRHFDIQLVGGMVLHAGKIAEMATGEGKTLVATLAAYLNGLTGEGVHVVTVNDYLARRDREWMGPLYEYLGLSVGVIQHDMDPHLRQKAYACDITYGTNNEFGFDYLRDNMVNFKQEMAQRGHHYAIVDEVDSILIDEARTPLIISGPAEESTDKYYKANTIAQRLKGRRITEQQQVDAKYKNIDLTQGYDYLADEKVRAISLTDAGEEKAAHMFGIENLHAMETIEYRHHVLAALRAKEFFRHDVDYVVRDGEVIIVDEFTGRLMPGRRWSDGLHQAVEAKEGIQIQRENQTLATITFQNYFRMYEKLAGMTGTAHTEANEFKQIYNLDVVVTPPNRILLRTNYPDCVYKTESEKFNAVVQEILELNQKGEPILVGTISIEKSERLSDMLKRRGIPHQVLNAKYHELEAQIIAQAGRKGAVTIATNMAGRGTDILLGGNAEYLARNLAEEEAKAGEDQVKKQELIRKFLQQFKEQVAKEHDEVVTVGGLHVIGTERHESRRIDNQLRGRSGRQGDPGSSRFYVSLEDDLMRLFASDKLIVLYDRLGMEEGQVIEHPWVTRAIEIAQKRVETHNFEIRKHLLEFDNVMNQQREAIYSLRRSVLESEDVKNWIEEAIQDLAGDLLEQFLGTDKEEMNWDLAGLALYLNTKFNYDTSIQIENFRNMTPEQISESIAQGLLKIYAQKEEEMALDQLRFLERMLLLRTIDAKWKDHLYAMDQLKDGISLRSYGQRDPLIEFKREGFEMFQMMYDSIHQEVIEILFNVQTIKSKEVPRGVFSALPQQFVHQEFSGLAQAAVQRRQQKAASGSISAGPVPVGTIPPQEPREAPKPQPIQRTTQKVGRNDPCPCGSGKKFKRCCGR